MSMPLEPASATPVAPRTFWRTWRRDIIRGGVLFGLAACAALAVSQMSVSSLPVTLAQLRSLKDFDIDPDGNLFGAGRSVGDQWEWHGPVAAGQTVWIRNLNGPIEVVAGTGQTLEVAAEKSWRRSSPDVVELVPVATQQGVTICALWRARQNHCGDRGDYEQHDIRHNDVAVRFTVKLPRGVHIDVSTVNGQLAIDGASEGIQASTVNGRVLLHAMGGPIKAETVNGSVETHLDALVRGDVEVETVNGSVTAIVPARLNALLDAQTVNGRVQTDVPVQMAGKISPRHVHGTMGTGGLNLKLTTVNGSITIREAGLLTPPPEPGAPVGEGRRAPRATRATPVPSRP